MKTSDISLFLHGSNTRGNGLVKIEFFTYTLKFGIIVFQRQIVESKEQISLMEVISLTATGSCRTRAEGHRRKPGGARGSEMITGNAWWSEICQESRRPGLAPPKSEIGKKETLNF